MSTRIGVDVGGTFTDLIFFDEETGEVTVGKGPSNPRAVDSPSARVVAATLHPRGGQPRPLLPPRDHGGAERPARAQGRPRRAADHRGLPRHPREARVARLDERGQRVWDRLFRTPAAARHRAAARRRHRADLRRRQRRHAARRDDVRAAAEIFTAEGVECVAVVFINAHANPTHELARRSSCARPASTGEVSLSHHVTGEYREYERTSTTVIDAYVRPAVSGYLSGSSGGLRRGRGFDGDMPDHHFGGRLHRLRGGRPRPFETVMSGPVAGAVGAGALCRELGIATGDHGRRRRHELRHLPARRRAAAASSTRARSSACRSRRPGSTSARSAPAAARSPMSSDGLLPSGRAAPAPSRARSPTAAAAPSRP